MIKLIHNVRKKIYKNSSQKCTYIYYSTSKYEKNTKFKEELYKYHYNPYIDDANIRPYLILKSEVEKITHDKRLKRNVPLVYSNEIKNIEELKNNPFTLVNVKNENNELFGVATFNPYSLITARIINNNSLFSINIHFFIEKIKQSLLWRSKIIKKQNDYDPFILTSDISDNGPTVLGEYVTNGGNSNTDIVNDKIVNDKIVSDKIVSDKIVNDKIVSDKIVNDKIVSDKIVNDKIISDKIVNDKIVSDKIVNDKIVNDNNDNNSTNTSTSSVTPNIQINKVNNYQYISSSSYTILNNNFCYRLINSEGDNMPGIIIDRYDKFISIQHLTLGCEMLACNINDAIIELLNPIGIIFRNDNKERLNERLEIYKKVIYGSIPEQVILNENNCFFLIDLLNSPNTGWFFNRKCLRKLLCSYAYNKNVLDLFSYVGSFGIQCAKIGKAKNVICVEKNNQFVQLAEQSAYLNNIKNNIQFICSDYLQFLTNSKELFDIIILDPPNLIPKSKFLESGSKKYIEMINLAQNYITSNGLLLIIFTTKLLSYQQYIHIINKAFFHTNRNVKIVGQGRASPDHPIHLSLYLYSDFYWFILQVSY
ncbi:conserved protein, unknown function [Hepatocystis sp. ex Piliocolobus tephrosceles]|nr:conserved protein, unknown function [Hepatocystis sp. ex Piliocolobus tephrosceles]